MPKYAVLLIVFAVFTVGCELAALSSQVVEQPTTAIEGTNGTAAATVTTQAQATAASLKPTPTAPRAQPGAGAPTTAAPVPPKTPVPAPAALKLNVISPQDEATVNVASIAVVGQTTAGAVVSVDGNLVDVDAAGKFQTALTLDEGPNIIEVVASDQTGNELDTILRVIYEP